MTSNMDATTKDPASAGPSLLNEPDLKAEAALMSEFPVPTGDIGAGRDASEEGVEHLAGPPDGERPQNRTTGLYSGLKRLVAEAKGAASKPVINFCSLNGTKLIFVVGQSGTGKSTFLREISSMELHIGKTRNSGLYPSIFSSTLERLTQRLKGPKTTKSAQQSSMVNNTCSSILRALVPPT
ncbi:hypothetical protein GGR51DRAFT_522029 [Nemania sp. FL0031]|nr:hypothetical protein GGR51DRAFT_522029 [Nemania sp. FL0031]